MDFSIWSLVWDFPNKYYALGLLLFLYVSCQIYSIVPLHILLKTYKKAGQRIPRRYIVLQTLYSVVGWASFAAIFGVFFWPELATAALAVQGNTVYLQNAMVLVVAYIKVGFGLLSFATCFAALHNLRRFYVPPIKEKPWYPYGLPAPADGETVFPKEYYEIEPIHPEDDGATQELDGSLLEEPPLQMGRKTAARRPSPPTGGPPTPESLEWLEAVYKHNSADMLRRAGKFQSPDMLIVPPYRAADDDDNGFDEELLPPETTMAGTAGAPKESTDTVPPSKGIEEKPAESAWSGVWHDIHMKAQKGSASRAEYERTAIVAQQDVPHAPEAAGQQEVLVGQPDIVEDIDADYEEGEDFDAVESIVEAGTDAELEEFLDDDELAEDEEYEDDDELAEDEEYEDDDEEYEDEDEDEEYEDEDEDEEYEDDDELAEDEEYEDDDELAEDEEYEDDDELAEDEEYEDDDELDEDDDEEYEDDDEEYEDDDEEYEDDDEEYEDDDEEYEDDDEEYEDDDEPAEDDEDEQVKKKKK